MLPSRPSNRKYSKGSSFRRRLIRSTVRVVVIFRVLFLLVLLIAGCMADEWLWKCTEGMIGTTGRMGFGNDVGCVQMDARIFWKW